MLGTAAPPTGKITDKAWFIILGLFKTWLYKHKPWEKLSDIFFFLILMYYVKDILQQFTKHTTQDTALSFKAI